MFFADPFRTYVPLDQSLGRHVAKGGGELSLTKQFAMNEKLGNLLILTFSFRLWTTTME